MLVVPCSGRMRWLAAASIEVDQGIELQANRRRSRRWGLPTCSISSEAIHGPHGSGSSSRAWDLTADSLKSLEDLDGAWVEEAPRFPTTRRTS